MRLKDTKSLRRLAAADLKQALENEVYWGQYKTSTQKIGMYLSNITNGSFPGRQWQVKGNDLYFLFDPTAPADNHAAVEHENQRLAQTLVQAGLVKPGKKMDGKKIVAPLFELEFASPKSGDPRTVRLSLTNLLEERTEAHEWLKAHQQELGAALHRNLRHSRAVSISLTSSEATEKNSAATVLEEFAHLRQLLRDNIDYHARDRADRVLVRKDGKPAFVAFKDKIEIHAVDDERVLMDVIALAVRQNGANLKLENATPEFEAMLPSVIAALKAEGRLLDAKGRAVEKIVFWGASGNRLMLPAAEPSAPMPPTSSLATPGAPAP